MEGQLLKYLTILLFSDIFIMILSIIISNMFKELGYDAESETGKSVCEKISGAANKIGFTSLYIGLIMMVTVIFFTIMNALVKEMMI